MGKQDGALARRSVEHLCCLLCTSLDLWYRSDKGCVLCAEALSGGGGSCGAGRNQASVSRLWEQGPWLM